MSTLRQLTTVMCIAIFATLTGTSAIASADDDAFAVAMQLYQDGHYANAYGHLAALADGGHPDAARIALLMVRFGPQLYGSQWLASDHQFGRWLELASTRHSRLVAGNADLLNAAVLATQGN